MSKLLEISELLLDSLEKSAAELDAKDAEIARLKKAAVRPTPALVEKLANTLVKEELLAESMSAKEAVHILSNNPDAIIKLAQSLLTPNSEGVVLEPASTKQASSEESPLVVFEGRTFLDPTGWLKALG